MIISLPTEDRPRSYAFYQEAFGFMPIGDLAEDGVPEPLQFALTEDVRLMLIPTGGFGWVLGEHPAAPRGTSECILSIPLESEAAVDALFTRATTAGATALGKPTRHPWAYTATVTDPDGHVWMLETT
jgi:predicted lactoylglutathione lyase